MLEKDIENIIANYPDDFFPDSGLELIGQQVKLGTCRADIIFKDKYDRTIIVEVKRGILSRDASGQIMEYYGLLKQQEPDKVVELILCANVIPPERKLFLENAGIECKELGLSLIPNIAQKYNYKFLDSTNKKQNVSNIQITKELFEDKNLSLLERKCVWIFQSNPNRYDILNALSALKEHSWQVNRYKDEIKKGDIALIWMSGKDAAGIYAVGEIVKDPSWKQDYPEEEKYWINDDDKGKTRWGVFITINYNLVNSPMYKNYLKDIKELKELSIIKQPQGTNFRVKEEEWPFIKKMIMDRINS
jgi:predicted RNA-binding protein with PUA-like domain